MNEYLLRIKALVDSLAAIGSPISVNEHIESIFDGFTKEYIPFIIVVNS